MKKKKNEYEYDFNEKKEYYIYLYACWKSVQWKKRNNFIKLLKYGEYVPLLRINIIAYCMQ